MSKRSSSFQINKDHPDSDRDGAEDTAKKATAKTMSSRKILNPKSRRRPGGGDLSSIGNPFAPVDPNVNGGSPSPAESNTNPFNNIAFGSSAQSQSFPVTNFGGASQTSGSQNSSFPPSQNSSANIFSNMNGSSSGFTFGGGSTNNNPFSKATQSSSPPQTQTPAPKFNFLQPSSQTNHAPSQTSNVFGQSPQSSAQRQSHQGSIFGAVPATPPASHEGDLVTNRHESQKTSPNDMDMVSPPSSNKFSNPLAGPSSSSSSTVPPPIMNNLFGSTEKSSTKPVESNSGAVSPPFGSGASSISKPTDTVISSNNIFSNLSKSAQPPSSSTPNSNGLFGNLNKSTETSVMPGDSSRGLFGHLPKDPTPNAGTFNTIGSTSTSAHGPGTALSDQPKSNQFSSALTDGPLSETPSLSKTSNSPFASTPQPSASVLHAPLNPKYGQDLTQAQASMIPANAPDTRQFDDVFASTHQNRSTKNRGSATNAGIFGSPVTQSTQSNPPMDENKSGELPPDTQSLDHSVSPAGFAKPLVDPNDDARKFKQLNESIRGAILTLDMIADWTVPLNNFLEAYRSSMNKVNMPSAQLGRPGAIGGTKRKEQADPADEAPRASKQLNSTPTSSLFSHAQAPEDNTTKPSLFTPAKPVDNSLSAPLLFQPRNEQPASTPTHSPFTSSQIASSSTPEKSLFAHSKAQSNTSRLFQDIVDNGDSAGNAAERSASAGKTKNVTGNSLFGQSTSNNVFGNANGANPSLFGQPAGVNESGPSRAVGSNIFDPFNNSSNVQDEHEGSEDGETIEDAMRSKSRTPPVGKSLFERISGGPTTKDAASDSNASESESVADGTDQNEEVDSQFHASTGDHTWKPEKTIKFGESISSNSSSVNGNLFGQSKAPSSTLFGNSSTPAASPFKPSDTTLFGSSLKQTTNAASRASTPGTDVNGVSGVSASEAEGENPGQDNGVTDGEVTADKSTLSAEEQGKEEVIFEVAKLKMIQFNPAGKAPTAGHEHEEKDTRWITRGTGSFHVLKDKDSGEIRLLHRIAPRGTVLINSPILKRATFKKLPQKGTALIGAFGLVTDGEKEMTFQNWTARVGSDETAKELVKVLEENKREGG